MLALVRCVILRSSSAILQMNCGICCLAHMYLYGSYKQCHWKLDAMVGPLITCVPDIHISFYCGHVMSMMVKTQQWLADN